MNNQFIRERELKVDVKEFFWKLLTQWKAILVASVIMSLLVCGAKYFKDLSSYKAALEEKRIEEEQAGLDESERIDIVMNKLSDEDRLAVDYVVKGKAYLNNQQKYLEESLLMQTDPTNQRILRLTYDIDSGNAADLPIILKSFEVYTSSEAFTDLISEILTPDADSRSVDELVEIEGAESDEEMLDSNRTSAAVCVDIVLLNDSDGEAVAKAANNAIEQYSASLSAEYHHSIFNTGYEITYKYHKKNVEKQTNTISSIKGIYDAVNNIYGNLSDEQKAAVEKIEEIKKEGNNKSEMNGESSSDGNSSDYLKKNQSLRPTLSKKYILIGFVIGAMLYAGIYLLVFVFNDRFKSSLEAEGYMQTRLLGELYYKKKRKGFAKLLQSELVDKYHYNGKMDMSLQKDKMRNSINAVCKYKEIDKLLLLQMTKRDDEITDDAIKSIISCADGISIKTDVIEGSTEFNEKDLLDAHNAMFVVGTNTDTNRLSEMLDLCAEYGTSILGEVYIEEF